MRKLVYIISALILMVSCHGTIDPNDPSYVPEGVLRIFADKTEIKADGQQEVTFTVMFGSKDVSRDTDMSITRIADGVSKSGREYLFNYCSGRVLFHCEVLFRQGVSL